jgi:hypothetical protein
MSVFYWHTFKLPTHQPAPFHQKLVEIRYKPASKESQKAILTIFLTW